MRKEYYTCDACSKDYGTPNEAPDLEVSWQDRTVDLCHKCQQKIKTVIKKAIGDWEEKI